MIELTTSLLMLASAFSTSPATANMVELKGTAAEATTTVSQPTTIRETEEYVRSYFKDEPVLAEIARCESSFRQFDKDGLPLRGKVNKGDIGVMQINRYYHEDDANELGIDIYTLDGNLEFAKRLYGKYGNKPWSSSSKCWQNPRIDTMIMARA